MRIVKRIVLVASLVLAGVVYVWTAAVRAVPGVRARKAARRAARGRRAP